ncbi:hypothetical protein M1M27_gp05 [Cellulophaga phage Ingeline_1]|uniref:Uncharacterized protein n=1 Tax=Cellulophaga phage Ingeline_1 TaxID=2745674 RepID=A0A8E5EAF9_9CAUD|nr:hypothetical protein M1M27_gp05 [Cellulophaga phage Ingeline_1]QQV90035.1 hypothetical protein Ingeline2_46 [Cellulophaga phage Ingeline_2]QQV90085.1 hypothetical protein Ingeline3_46 [Cellulophaga phage Ingeline_3]QQV90135.1 hypothetical protein Ingeline4_46 [Cellulophaga phage Ingeline_4]QQV90184.1 hypothetical protein Ingeline5_45 [Cellulophaga phage Ingeline_5]QQV90234.1 hypothetical protein Ingeline6_46 [Cellulophaga phage Ingeline_6]QQV90284.1 hypothetical protein Ingeline7_46 [Cellu
MHKIEIPELNKVFDFPENGTEFTQQQFLFFSNLMLQYNANAITYDQFKNKLVYEFLLLKRIVAIENIENNIVIENIMHIGRLVDFYFIDQKVDGKIYKVVDMVLFVQLMPKIVSEGVTFYGPESAMINTVYGEYIQALNAFLDYSNTGKEMYLDKLIATIYRPEKKNSNPDNPTSDYTSDVRTPFNPHLTDHYSKKLTKIAPQVKNAVYLFFASCQHFIVNSDALDVGGGNSIDVTVLFKQTGGAGNVKGLGIVGTLYSIAETTVFGDVDKVAATNTYDIFAFLVEQHNKMENLKNSKKNA